MIGSLNELMKMKISMTNSPEYKIPNNENLKNTSSLMYFFINSIQHMMKEHFGEVCNTYLIDHLIFDIKKYIEFLNYDKLQNKYEIKIIMDYDGNGYDLIRLVNIVFLDKLMYDKRMQKNISIYFYKNEIKITENNVID